MFNRNCCRQNYGMQNYGMQNQGMQNYGASNYGRQGCCQRQMTQPIVEPTITKCIQKDFYHEVPQE